MSLIWFKLILLFLFSRSTVSQSFPDRKPLDCDRDLQKKVNNEQFTFLFQQKHLFIILSDYLIMFREPKFDDSNEKQASLLIKKPFIVKVDDRLHKGMRGVLDQNHQSIYTIRSSENGLRCHLIDFSPNQLLREISENPCEKEGLNTTGLLDPNFDYVYSLVTQDSIKKGPDLDIILKYRKNELVFENRDELSSFKKVIPLDYTVRKAAADLRYENIVFEIENDEKQNGRPVLHFNQVKLKRSEKTRLIDFSYEFSFKMPLDDFLGCIGPLDSYDHVKGIFFNKNIVYLVLRQFYVMFEASLIDDRFEGVTDEALYENRSVYRASDYQLDRIRFDESRKWVKTIGGEVYLSFYVQDTYKAVFSGELINLERSAKIDDLMCDKQTLEVSGDVFCFEEKHYQKMQRIDTTLSKSNSSRSYPISEMFSEVKEFVYEEQNLLFIFNYVDNNFIFMTDQYFFRIEHSRVHQVNNGRLVIRYDHLDLLDYQENCLLEKCKTPKIRRKKDNTYLISIIVLTLVIVALSLITFFFVYKRAPKWRSASTIKPVSEASSKPVSKASSKTISKPSSKA